MTSEDSLSAPVSHKTLPGMTVKRIQLAPKKDGRFGAISENPVKPRCSSPGRFSKGLSDCCVSGLSGAHWPIARHLAHRVRNFSCAAFDLFILGLHPEFCRPLPFPFPFKRRPRAFCTSFNSILPSLHNDLKVDKPVGFAAGSEGRRFSSKESLSSSVCFIVSRW